MLKQNDTIPLHMDAQKRIQVYFLAEINQKEQEGLYNLFFHNCHNYQKSKIAINFTVSILLGIKLTTLC